MITALVEGQQNKWEEVLQELIYRSYSIYIFAGQEVLPHALFAMRTAVCQSTGLTPYKVLFVTSLDLIFADPNLEASGYSSHDTYAQALRHRIESAHTWAWKNMAGPINRQRRAYQKDQKCFTPGDMVWLFTPRLSPGQSKKFAGQGHG